jgi:hypothetical protein
VLSWNTLTEEATCVEEIVYGLWPGLGGHGSCLGGGERSGGVGVPNGAHQSISLGQCWLWALGQGMEESGQKGIARTGRL